MPYKLLLADDSVTIQRVIELTFADEDIQVLAVGDGKKAIASIQSDRPDIVLADVGMPERDGYEVASFIKTTAELSHIPVLLLTGAFEPIDEARARAVGCDGVLVKPFEPQMVINRVKDLLAGRRTGGPWSAVPAGSAPGAAPGQSARGAAAAATAAPAGSLEDYFDRLDAAFATMDSPSAPAPAPPLQAPPVSRPAFDAGPAAPGAPLPDGLADWDPDLTGAPSKTAAMDPPSAGPSAARAGHDAASGGRAATSGSSGSPAVETPSPAHRPAAFEGSAPPAAVASAPAAAPRATPSAAAPRPGGYPQAAPGQGQPAAQGQSVSPPTLAEAFAALLSAEQGRSVAASSLGTIPDAAVDEIVRLVVNRMTDTAVRDTVAEVADRLVREEIERIKRA